MELKRSLEPRMKCHNEKATTNCDDSTDSTVSSLHHSSPSHQNLELPKFFGEFLDWQEFRSFIAAHIQGEAGLTDVEKITCLEDAMNYETVKDLVRLNGYGCSYDKIVQLLKLNKIHKLVYKHHL